MRFPSSFCVPSLLVFLCITTLVSAGQPATFDCLDTQGVPICHQLADCVAPGVCECPFGTMDVSEGTSGTDCANEGWAIRYVVDKSIGDDPIDPDATWQEIADEIRSSIDYYCLDGVDGFYPRGVPDIFSSDNIDGVDVIQKGHLLIEINCLYASKPSQATIDVYANSFALDQYFYRRVHGSTVKIAPKLYAWTWGTTGSPLRIPPTGMEVTSVSFNTTCEDSGCWVIKGVMTSGNAYNAYESFATFFLPQAISPSPVGALSYDHPYSATEVATFSPANHPCTSAQYEADDLATGLSRVSTCCIMNSDGDDFVTSYRPTEAFVDYFDDWLSPYATDLNPCTPEIVERPHYNPPAQRQCTNPACSACVSMTLSSSCNGRLIPDSGTSGISEDCGITVPSDVVSINWISITGLTHTWRADLRAALVDPAGNEKFIFLAAGVFQDLAGDYTFACEGSDWTEFDWTVPDLPSGTYQSYSPLGGISGAAGVWSLRIYDDAIGDSGEFDEWSIGFQSVPDERRSFDLDKGRSIQSVPASRRSFDPEAPNATVAFPPNYLHFLMGSFKDMSSSGVVKLEATDVFFGQYEFEIHLDEVELRSKAGMLTGTINVEYAVDTFLGLASFRPTGFAALDTFATQTAIHLEKTNFFSVSTHGVNDYTFLEYVNLRLVSVLVEDDDFSGVDESTVRMLRTRPDPASHYVQVTFTLGQKYGVNENSGLIPLDSVRAGKGVFFDDADLEHKCSEWFGIVVPDSTSSCFQSRSETGCDIPACEASVCSYDPYCCNTQWDNVCVGKALTDDNCLTVVNELFVGKDIFEASLSQDCAPAGAMCESPTAIPDNFVSFNIPLGVDFLGSASPVLDNNIFVEMVISAIDLEARGISTSPNDGEAPWQMKTTLTASIPVVDGGVNIFCDGIVAKTDLKDVANADIVVGSAATPQELLQLQIKKDIASTQLSPQSITQINSDSIEAGLMTLVLKGDESYSFFGDKTSALAGVSLELEDVITIHIMDSSGSGADAEVASEVMDLITADPADNSDTNGLITEGYALNEAFFFEVDRDSQRAHLQPSPALLALCPFNPTPPGPDAELETCVTRRDVRFRGYPARAGSVATAMEICANLGTGLAANQGVNSGCLGDACCSTDVTSAESQFFTTILGDSAYARQLAIDYAAVIADEYELNQRFRRAFWINPGYEWTPTQTGGTAIFSVSQKLFLFALITLDEGISTNIGEPYTRRRMLLQSTPDGLKNAQASVGGQVVEFQTSPRSMMAKAFEVPEDRVATFAVQLQLTEEEACMEPRALQNALRESLEDYVQGGISAYHTLQVASLRVDKGDVSCGRRSLRTARKVLSAFSAATADVTMLVVFKPGKPSQINLERLAKAPGVNDIKPLEVSENVIDSTVTGDIKIDDSDNNNNNNNTALIIGVVCGVVGGLFALSAGVLLFFRSRRPAAEEVAIPSIDVNTLKAQLEVEA